MNGRTVPSPQTVSGRLGSSAVDGLTAGAGAGLVMVGYLILALAFMGIPPADLLVRFTTNELNGSVVVGVIGHLAVSAIYGMIFAVIWQVVSRRLAALHWRLLASIAYGMLLYILARQIILPSVSSPLLDISPLHFGIAHAIYGLVLGYLSFHRREG